jgi:hypothetical protein
VTSMWTFSLGKRCYVVRWTGFQGALAKHRWGRTGARWPNYYLGPIAIHQGPR